MGIYNSWYANELARKSRERGTRTGRESQPRDNAGHKGGFGKVKYGEIDGHQVTVAFGWGSKSGHTLLADGHIPAATFLQHGNHNHYGPGDGPNSNVKDRFKYTGPGH